VARPDRVLALHRRGAPPHYHSPHRHFRRRIRVRQEERGAVDSVNAGRRTSVPSYPQQGSVPPADRTLSFEKTDSKVKISDPIGGTPIPAGYKLGDKDTFALDASAAAAANDRREKAKSRSFLGGFGRSGGSTFFFPEYQSCWLIFF
jgi:RalA-binding protein 1